MRMAVAGNDLRLTYLARLLGNSGHVITSDPVGADIAVTRWPPDAPVSGASHIVSCGPASAPAEVTDLLRDEDYQSDIAYMTAEGAVCAAMSNSTCTLRGADCLVVGWGRIGRQLAVLLVSIGAKVTALTRRKSAYTEISACGAEPGDTAAIAAHLAGKKYIFSTPASRVLDRDALAHADRYSLIIDLASPPYGVDIEAANEMNIKAWREPGLPGRYCPETAAEAINRALDRAGLLKGDV